MSALVTSLEISKKLYELSGWEDTDKWWYQLDNVDEVHCMHEFKVDKEVTEFKHSLMRLFPAYPLGYLLRKLPKATDINTDKWEESFDCSIPEMFFMAWEMDTMDHKWRVQMQVEDEVLEPILFEADNPEDAACLLLIRLFEEGILVKE